MHFLNKLTPLAAAAVLLGVTLVEAQQPAQQDEGADAVKKWLVSELRLRKVGSV
jgi:hypothetical protein